MEAGGAKSSAAPPAQRYVTGTNHAERPTRGRPRAQQRRTPIPLPRPSIRTSRRDHPPSAKPCRPSSISTSQTSLTSSRHADTDATEPQRSGEFSIGAFGENSNGIDNRLAHDPAMRAVVDRGGLDRRAASTSQMGRFETGWLASDINRAALADLSGAWIDRVHARRPQTTIVLDMDSSVSETHGAQEGSAYNGHFGCTCYHPLFVFNQFGDLERCALRSGNVHSADGWREVLEPVVARYRGKVSRIYFRADAGFANPEVYEFLEAERI